MNELLGALGLAWPRLLIYPGGLVALLCAWLLDRLVQDRGQVAESGERRAESAKRFSASARQKTQTAERFSATGREPSAVGSQLTAFDLLPPLILLSLLPLPPARGFPYGLDLPTALLLADWPRWRILAASGQLAPAHLRSLLPGYALLLCGAGTMSSALDSLELSALTRWPATLPMQIVVCIGALLWLSGCIVTTPQRPDRDTALHWALRLRTLALLSIPMLVLIGALATGLRPWFTAAQLSWLLPPLAFGGIVISYVMGQRVVRSSALMPHPPNDTRPARAARRHRSDSQ
jgi:hypothetical protein